MLEPFTEEFSGDPAITGESIDASPFVMESFSVILLKVTMGLGYPTAHMHTNTVIYDLDLLVIYVARIFTSNYINDFLGFRVKRKPCFIWFVS